MKDFTIKRCQKCLLPENEPQNIRLDNNLICNICRQEAQEVRMDWAELEAIFENTLAKHRGKGAYDGVIMMSGGKDSAYLAYLLKRKYKLNLLGVINDIHYEYQETFDNAQKICAALEIPLQKNTLPKKMMQDFFNFLFTDQELRDKGHGHICLYCGRLMIRVAGEYAKAKGIPLVFSGHNPQQVFGMGESFEVDENRKIRQQMIIDLVNTAVTKSHVRLRLRNKNHLLPFFPKELFPAGVSGLFMYQHFAYKPLEMMATIKKELGWQPINKFSKTYIASGCRLAKLWMHLAGLNNTSNYVDLELSEQVRNGVLSKDMVKKFYEEAFDATTEIEGLLAELNITGGVAAIK
ncbi:MAG: hypothetical protein LRZ99_00685 [Desulfotomaculum sp.]|nr:hypothetical protein [Desulfotomaculum sp.]